MRSLPPSVRAALGADEDEPVREVFRPVMRPVVPVRRVAQVRAKGVPTIGSEANVPTPQPAPSPQPAPAPAPEAAPVPATPAPAAPSRVCRATGCTRKVLARGLCGKHYGWWRRGSQPVPGVTEPYTPGEPGGRGVPRARRTTAPAARTAAPARSAPTPAAPRPSGLRDRLLELLPPFDPGWSADVQGAWMHAYSQLVASFAGKGA